MLFFLAIYFFPMKKIVELQTLSSLLKNIYSVVVVLVLVIIVVDTDLRDLLLVSAWKK